VKKVIVNDAIKEQAMDYATRQGQALGFAVGSAKWKAALESQLGHAYSTMAVGRNPGLKSFSKKLAVYQEVYPQIFSKKTDGFLGRISKNEEEYKQNAWRLDAAVSNLAGLYAEKVLGIFQKQTVDAEGRKHKADTEMPKRSDDVTKAEFANEIKKVVKNWGAIAMVEDVIYNALGVLFRIRKEEFDQLKINIIDLNIDASENELKDLISDSTADLLKLVLSPRTAGAFLAIDYIPLAKGQPGPTRKQKESAYAKEAAKRQMSFPAFEGKKEEEEG
jgi:hypothetical protein